MRSGLAMAAVLGIAMISGCATTRYEEYVSEEGTEGSPTQSRAEVRPGTPSTMEAGWGEIGTLLSMEERISRLEAEIARRQEASRASTGDLATQVRSLAEQLTEIRKQLEALRDLREASSGSESAPSSNVRRDSRVAPVLDPGRAYELALSAFNTNDYGAAQGRFQEVLDLAPTGDLADNAQYWIGECEYARGAWGAAIESFRKVFHFNATEKDDDAQFKLGLCHLKLGQREHALIEFTRLTVDFPESEYVGRSENHVRDLRARQGTER